MTIRASYWSRGGKHLLEVGHLAASLPLASGRFALFYAVACLLRELSLLT